MPTIGAPLAGVAARSANDAWAVGGRSGGGDVRHWNDRAWTVATKLDSGHELLAVAEVSPTHAWAVDELVKR